MIGMPVARWSSSSTSAVVTLEPGLSGSMELLSGMARQEGWGVRVIGARKDGSRARLAWARWLSGVKAAGLAPVAQGPEEEKLRAPRGP